MTTLPPLPEGWTSWRPAGWGGLKRAPDGTPWAFTIRGFDLEYTLAGPRNTEPSADEKLGPQGYPDFYYLEATNR